MGRAVKPSAIRRLEYGGEIEVMSASGFWSPIKYLSTASLDNLVAALKANGKPAVSELPIQPFEYVLGDHDKGGDMPPREGGDRGEGNAPDQGGDPSPDQGEGDGGGDGQGGDGGVTIEDIVRRIAGEMDLKVAEAVIQAADQLMTDKLADYSPKGGDGIDPLIVKIQVETPQIKLDKDGIFHKMFPTLVKLVSMGQHTYLPGPPGTGKSHAAEQVATTLGWRFASISLGPTTPESRLWGGMDAHGKFFEPPFVTLARHAADNPESGSVFCLDELDNGHPGIIATLNSAMANGWFTAPNGDVISIGKNFTIVGAANTFGTGPTAEFAGRNKLDAATLDRFAYLPWDTDLGVEKALVHQYLDAAAAKAWLEVWRTCRKNVKDNGLKVFVTMRGAVNGARLVAAGVAPQDALDMVLLNKLPDDQRRKVAP